MKLKREFISRDDSRIPLLDEIPEGSDPSNYVTHFNSENGSRQYTQILPEEQIPTESSYDSHEQTSRRTLLTTFAVGAAAISASWFAKEGIKASVDYMDERLSPYGNEQIDWKTIYTVKTGEGLWEIVQNLYPNFQDDDSWILDFIENNIRNLTAENDGREKDDLYPGDELEITKPSDPS